MLESDVEMGSRYDDRFKFEVGQILEMVREQKELDYVANVIRRYVEDDSVVKEIVALNPNRDGDLFRVCERRVKRDADNVEHDLYLCQSLNTQEFTLFGRSGLRFRASSESKEGNHARNQ